MIRKFLALLLIMLFLVPVMELEPVYAAEHWEDVADVTLPNPGGVTTGLAILARGSTSTISSRTDQQFSVYAKPDSGTYVITSFKTQISSRNGERRLVSVVPSVVARGQFDPLNYQYACITFEPGCSRFGYGDEFASIREVSCGDPYEDGSHISALGYDYSKIISGEARWDMSNALKLPVGDFWLNVA